MKPSENPGIHGKIPATELRRYWDVFHDMLADAEAPLDVRRIYDAFDVKSDTVKKHLRRFIRHYPHLLGNIVGFYPDSHTIIDLAEKHIGEPVRGDNLLAVNNVCKEMIDGITKPRHAQFLRRLLAKYADNGALHAPLSELIDLLYEEYPDFIHQADNALVSIAGRMNEEILLRALANEGLEPDRDFIRTGKNSEADILIHQAGGHRKTLYCEVKSWHARERFLRGLADIPHAEKAGVGFFRDPTEFNPERTRTILRANPMAVYLPEDTLAALHPESRDSRTTDQNLLYRPLGRFPADARYFREHGRLPVYRGD